MTFVTVFSSSWIDLANLVPRVLWGRVGENPGNEVETWPVRFGKIWRFFNYGYFSELILCWLITALVNEIVL